MLSLNDMRKGRRIIGHPTTRTLQRARFATYQTLIRDKVEACRAR